MQNLAESKGGYGSFEYAGIWATYLKRTTTGATSGIQVAVLRNCHIFKFIIHTVYFVLTSRFVKLSRVHINTVVT